MSGNNPYAVNGSRAPNPYANPYATNSNASLPTNTSIPSGRYNDPYLNPQNNASSASVQSFASQERQRRSNQYDQRERDPPGPAQGPGPQPSGRAGPARAPGGYGGLGRSQFADPPPPQSDDYGYGREREPSDYDQRQQKPSAFERERDRGYNENRTRDIQDGRAAMPAPLSTLPPKPSQPSLPALGQQRPSMSSASGGQGYAPPENANRHYSPRRPAKSMDEILKHIQSDWKEMEGEECIPVKIALKLMDPSSLGMADKEGDFADTHVDLQKSLKTVVNEHYADFNSAVGTYHKIQNAIRESQNRVRALKGGLMGVRGGMLNTRPELRGLAEQSGELDEILVVLGNMESLKTVPGKLEEKISEKKFLGAVDMLMDSLKTITKSDFDGIGAISDLRSYFANQESTLLDILVEELHDHLYLRSPYCRDRWKGTDAKGEDRDPKDTLMGIGVSFWERPFNHYLNNADLATPMVEDASKNPEADTFYYIHMILESLNKLGQLSEAITRIEQRMPVELYKVVEKTNNEIDGRYPSHLRGHLGRDRRKSISLQPNDGRSQVLSDFLWTLYSKFEAIAESHRVLHEVVAGIVARENLAKPENYTGGFKELWKLYQMEMRSLLHDYLATDGDMALRTGLTTTTNTNIFVRPPRDKSKKMFKLSEIDQKSEAVRTEEEELDDILKSSVPGLVSKSRQRNGGENTSERIQDSTAAGHKLLIEPGVFNMTILLPPSLAFLQRLKDVVPSTSNIPMSTLTSFLDDFLINVFHPQLEEAVTELCVQCMIDLEAFTQDPQWSKHSPYPVFKGTTAFMVLIRAFSGMLSSIPQDQMFTQLVITQLITYYDKCYGEYKALVSRVSPSASNSNINALSLKAAASYAESGEVHDIAMELLNSDSSAADSTSRSSLVQNEVSALIAATKATPLSSYDIISDPKSVHQLSLLYNSMQWLSSALAQLRHVEASAPALSHARTGSHNSPRNPRRWTLVTNLRTGSKPSHPGGGPSVYLPLTSETSIPFDTALKSFRTLATTSLLTLHIDIRCGIIHQLSRTLRGPDPVSNAPTSPQPTSSDTPNPPLDSGLYPYVIPTPPTSASPLILELNNDLIAFDANVSSYLPAKARWFIIAGLARLVDRYIVVAADKIGAMNTHGAERVRIDVMVVQQNLRGILAGPAPATSAPTAGEPGGLGITTTTTTSSSGAEEDETLLVLASRYFDLFLSGPESVLAYVNERKAAGQDPGFTYDELRTLVELWFSCLVRGEDREEAIKARKSCQEILLSLGERMWDG